LREQGLVGPVGRAGHDVLPLGSRPLGGGGVVGAEVAGEV
jgi:hypothetical protein